MTIYKTILTFIFLLLSLLSFAQQKNTIPDSALINNSQEHKLKFTTLTLPASALAYDSSFPGKFQKGFFNKSENRFKSLVKRNLPVMTDSLPAADKVAASFFQKRFNGIHTAVTDSIKSLISFDKYRTSLQHLANEAVQDFKKQMAKPVAVTNAELSFAAQLNNSMTDSFASQNYYLIDLRAAGMGMDIPFTILYQNHDYPFIRSQNLDRFSFRYDREAYLQGLKKKLQGKIDPRNYLPKMKDPVDMLKTTAEAALKKDVNEIKENYKGLIDDKITQLGNFDDLALKNAATLRQQLMSPEWLHEIQKKSERLNQFLLRINAGLSYNKEEYDQLKTDMDKYSAVVKLVNKMEEHKNKWEQSGLVKKIRESGLLKKEKLKQILNEPGVITKAAKENLNLSSIQKLFLKITKLDIGQTTGALSALNRNNFLMNGLNTAFLSNRSAVSILAGSQRTINSLADMPFSNSLYNTNNRLMSFSVGRGNPAGGNQNMVSLLMAQASPGSNQFFSSYSAPRSSMVATVSRKIEFDKRNRIEIELSKSASQFGNGGSKDSTGRRNNFTSLFSTENFFSSAAVSVNYHGYFQQAGLENSFYIKTSGMNYDNPAVSFEPSGSKEAGINLRKQFVKNKLQVMLKTDVREYKFSSLTDNKWRTAYHLADIKWKMKKGQYVSLRYQPLRSVRVADGRKSVSASTQRVSFLASIAKKIGGNPYRNNVSLAYQQNKYAYTTGGQLLSNTSVQFSAMQNVIIGKYTFFSNTLYNFVDNPSGFIFFNSSFSSDLGLTYLLGKNISGSSSVNYQSINGWYRQVAFRQSLAGQLGKRINMNLFMDAGKNVKVFQPVPFGTVRGEISIQYLINQN